MCQVTVGIISRRLQEGSAWNSHQSKYAPEQRVLVNMRPRSALARSFAPTMLPLLLLLGAASAEPPKTIQKPIEHCPSIGYFFERQDVQNYPGTCYLCYCNNDGQAVCTIRDHERCDHNESNSVDRTDVRTDIREWTDVKDHGERNKRRRSKRGLMELFFDNAKKDVMLKSMSQLSDANEEDCKPKSSKSIGCPPKDWCTGCLVCDCDEKGEWKCHVMSFCEDKTPRPKGKKSKKIEATTKADETNDIQSNNIPENKNQKRSVKHKKNKKSKKNTTTTITTTTTTTSKPQMPKIAVKTLKKFIRKDQMKNVTGPPIVIIKKYISTLSPIDPELLKYKNDSQKLAQILYQQYEATQKPQNSHAVKREIKLEKVLKNKQKRTFELKYNARGRKPMNIKEHTDWKIKMKARKIERDHARTISYSKSFYSKQNELMNMDEKNRKTKKTANDDEYYDSGSQKKKATVILIPRLRRSKRNVLPLYEVPSNITFMDNDTVNMSVVPNDQVEALTSVIGINKHLASDLDNYKYTVDNIVTKKYEDEITSGDIVYESTIKYVDIITNNYNDTEPNTTMRSTTNYTNIEVETTTLNETTQNVNYDLKNYTVNEISTQFIDLDLDNNHTLETTTSTVYSSDNNQSTTKEFIINYETTTVTEKNQEINITATKMNINTNVTEIPIKKGYITSIDKIIKDFNKYALDRWKNRNKTKGIFANMYNDRQNNSIIRSMKSSSDDIENLLQSISYNRTKNNTTQNRMVAINYLKKIYSQLLSTKNNKSRLNNISVMESICDTFGPCKISTNKMEILNYKIADLISETKKALNIIRNIKQVLQLIDGAVNTTDKNVNAEVEFKSYVNKLNAVLTDSYKNPITETDTNNLNLIKNNTKVFINSIGKFAFILNDILGIIHSERMKYNNFRKRKILIKKVTRHRASEPLHKIKNLFLKFNVVQNSFMRNMYRAISDLERRNEQNALVYEKRVNEQRDIRYKKSVNKYMHKINYNLEKLRVLALKMSAKERKRRDLMDHDDAVDYLLTLMEYLLKNNNPVDSPPVVDGIDLLIDAIRRAPEIKPIKKKFLKHTSLMPSYPSDQSKAQPSSESEDDTSKNKNSNEKITDDFSIEKLNDTTIVASNNLANNEFTRKNADEYQKSASTSTTSSTAKYVDVEDLVFNGDVLPKVYIATVPTYDNDDVESEKEFAKQTIHKHSEIKEIKANVSSNDMEEESSTTKKTIVDNDDNSEVNATVTEKQIMTHFDRLNEEYEKQIKGKALSTKNLKPRRRKPKRSRKKSKENKSDVSTISKEIDEEKTRKKVIAEEAILRKHIATSTEDDPFQLEDESLSRDLTHLNSMRDNNDVFPSYFT
ncbi:uncharacterized protein LOC125238105 [Leguminivora glycinivorella]|uniref:uncharacterized protein LOC125238105 n=1 Tax=Leguminivora glycinivorella TaxID=1035111 RepID=UPI00200E29F4|nr:uncharacterized protein LOC125238105 [Leguminivora glycinivorella]